MRELENILERALALFPGPVLEAEAILLPQEAPVPTSAPASTTPATTATSVQAAEADPTGTAPLNKAELQALLQRNRWNQSRTAKELGWTLAKLRYWAQRLGLVDAES